MLKIFLALSAKQNKLNRCTGTTYLAMFEMLSAWAEQAKKLEAGEGTVKNYAQKRLQSLKGMRSASNRSILQYHL